MSPSVVIDRRPAATEPAKKAAPRAASTVRVNQVLVERLTRNLKLQLEAGVPLLRALHSQAAQEEDPKLANCITEVVRAIEGGASLGDALDHFPGVFTPVYRNMVRAGEASGTVERILGDIARYLSWTAEVKKTVKKALRYPILVLGATGLLILFILGWLMPRFQTLFAKLADELPMATKMLMGLGIFVNENWIATTAVIVAAPIALILLSRTGFGSQALTGFVTRLPVFGGVAKTIDLARMTRCMSVLSAAGITLVQALALTRDSVSTPAMRADIDDVHDRLLSGEPLTQSVAQTDQFPPMVVNMIAVGEEAGRLDAVFGRLADHYDEEARDKVAKAIQILEPVVTLTLGVVIGGVAVSILTTLYKVMMSAGR